MTETPITYRECPTCDAVVYGDGPCGNCAQHVPAERGCAGIILNGVDRRHEALTRSPLSWVYHDGGRFAAGFRGETGDCVTRAIAIATELPYRTVYDTFNALTKLTRRHHPESRRRRPQGARTGVERKFYDAYLIQLGWTWTPTMAIGAGCSVHLRSGELPMGRLIVRLSGHMAAVVDGVIHDTADPSRGGDRCIYGYYRKG